MSAGLPAEWSQEVARVQAVLFDVDGTLYRQRPVRVAMAAELVHGAVRCPVRTARSAQVLRAFRRTREALRHEREVAGFLDDMQYARCAERVGVDAEEVRAIVDEWMMRRPLKYLAGARRPGVETLLTTLVGRGVRVGALSDYPVEAKLDALGIAGLFSLQLCTLDRTINAFKPHPAGFRRACELWDLDPREVLYVGDRPEVDGAGAAAAGIRCVIIGGSGRRGDAARYGGYSAIAGFVDLRRAIVVR